MRTFHPLSETSPLAVTKIVDLLDSKSEERPCSVSVAVQSAMAVRIPAGFTAFGYEIIAIWH